MTTTRKLKRPHRLSGKKPPGALDWAVLVRYFGDLEIRDATANLHVQIIPEDNLCAIKNDCTACVFAIGTKRQTGGKCIFYSTIAYVELKDSQGRSYVARYSIPTALRAYIRKWDDNKIDEVVAIGFDLLAPTTTIRKKREANASYRARKAKGLVIAKPRAPAHSDRVLNFLEKMKKAA